MKFWEKKVFAEHEPLFNSQIPCSDSRAYQYYPSRFTWVYNKLTLYEAQGLYTVPHGVPYDSFPAFSKPIMNLFDDSAGARVVTEWKEERDYTAGHLLMPIINGAQYSTDVVVRGGSIKWSCSLKCNKDSTGNLSDFEIELLPEHCWESVTQFVDTFFSNFTGVLNFETMGDIIIECHLRMTPQFVSLYGHDWLKSVIDLYQSNIWEDVPVPTMGISTVLQIDNEPTVSWNKCDIEELEFQSSSVIMMCGINGSRFEKTTGCRTPIAVVNAPNRKCSNMVSELVWDTLTIEH